ncbi:GHMP family kinase ATP-binding protein [Orenia marismortui]|uniref:GHMP family kinase ATP-binding protein n=1 Tax=Orenia marismortui TaxID=46469 RepID=UPI000380D25D|nr:hypothetical protein [Orenia marismortui]
MEVTVKVPGTCGELVQGVIDGVNFHISCPIDVYSSVKIRLNRSLSEIRIDPKFVKTRLAIEKTLEHFNANLGLNVSIDSKLISAKGMASSTADIVAGIIATIIITDNRVDLELVRRIALGIEPTDASFLKGIVAFDHLQGKKLVYLGAIKAIPLLIFDVGGKVNTIDFNSRHDLSELKLAKQEDVKRAYELIKEGIRKNNLDLLARGAIISSLANQKILTKPYLNQLIKLCNQDRGILGVNIAHSGTLIGVLLRSDFGKKRVLAKIKDKFPRLNYLMETKIINGGYKVVREG